VCVCCAFFGLDNKLAMTCQNFAHWTQTKTELGIFVAHKDEIWHICCAQKRNLVYLFGIKPEFDYLLRTKAKFGMFVAHKDGIWHICCAQIHNLAYFLRTKTEFRMSIVNKLSDTLI